MRDVLKVIGTARLAADPELRSLPSGTSICELRIAWSTSRKNQSTGEWEDKSNYADLTVFGNQGDACARYLSKGRQIVFEARLEQDQWKDKDTGANRYKHKLVAEQVQFVGDGKHDGSPTSNGNPDEQRQAASGEENQDPGGDFQPATAAPADDDIPF